MKQVTLSLIAFVLLFSMSCKKKDFQDYQVIYRVTYEGLWSSSTHPTDFPGGAHWSPFIGLTHNEDVSLFETRTSASAGIQEVAETGGTTNIEAEIAAIIASGNGRDQVKGETFDSPGTSNEVLIGLDSAHTYVSLVSMVAPSPDWFVACENINLNFGGRWIDKYEAPVRVYDAGTDDGTTYTSGDAVTTPQGEIIQISSGPLWNGNDVATMGVFTFERIDRTRPE